MQNPQYWLFQMHLNNLHLPTQSDWYKKQLEYAVLSQYNQTSTDSFKSTKITYIYPHNQTGTISMQNPQYWLFQMHLNNLHLPTQSDWYKKQLEYAVLSQYNQTSTDSFKSTKITYIYPHNQTGTKSMQNPQYWLFQMH